MDFSFQNFRDTLNAEVKFTSSGVRLERGQTRQAVPSAGNSTLQSNFQTLRNVLQSEVKFAGGLRLDMVHADAVQEDDQDKKFQSALEKLEQGDWSGLEILKELGLEPYESNRTMEFVYIDFDYKDAHYSYKLPNKSGNFQQSDVSSLLIGSNVAQSLSNIEAPVIKTGVVSSDTEIKESIDENGNHISTEYKNGKKSKETVTNPEGKLVSVTKFDSNENISNIREYYESGILAKESEYQDGVLSKETHYRENGIKQREDLYNSFGKLESSKIYGLQGEFRKEEVYNEQGQVIKITFFINGVQTIQEIEYNEDGSKAVITNKDANGNINSKEYPNYEGNGTTLIVTYDSQGNKSLEEVYTLEQEVLLKETRFDEQGNKISETVYNEDGTKTVIEGDTETVYSADGETLSVTTYSSDGSKKVVKGNVETIYDDDGNKVREIETYEDGRVCTTDYRNGIKYYEVTTDKSGKKLDEKEYDNQGNLVVERVWRSNGAQRETTYSNGKEVSVVIKDPSGKVQSETIFNDDGGKTVTAYNDDGSKRVITYDADGNRISLVSYDKDGNMCVSTEDGGKILTTKDAEGNVVETTYDKAGNVVSTTTYNADGTKTVVTGNLETLYDAADNVISTTNYNADGTKTILEGNVETLYDFAGNVISTTTYNADGTKTVLEDNVETLYDAEGHDISTTTYNEDGSKIVVIDNKETVYDAAGNVISGTVHNADGTTTEVEGNVEITRDAEGNVVSTATINADGTKTVVKGNVTSVYGADGKQISKTVNSVDGNGLPIETVYEYDSEGNFAFITIKDYSTDGVYYRETKYDGDWHAIIQKSYKDGVHQSTLEYTYEYTSDNTYTRIIEYTEGLGKGRKITEYYENNKKTQVVTEYEDSYNSADKEVKYFDAEGNVIRRTVLKDNVETEYDKDGKILSTTVYNSNGTKTVTIDNVDTVYDADGNEVSVTTNNADGSKTVVEGNKETIYDKGGKVVSITTHNADGTKTVVKGNEETLYDANGNTISTATINPDGTKSVTIDNETFVYGKDGNLISTTTYRTENGKNYATTMDADGNKIEETVSFNDDKGNPKTERSVFGSGEKLVSKTINYIDGNGNPREDYTEYDTEGNVAFKIVRDMSANKRYTYETKYDASGRKIEQRIDKDGSLLRKAKYSYEVTGDNTYTCTIKYTDGDLKDSKTTEYYENGKRTKYVTEYASYWNGYEGGDVETVYCDSTGKPVKGYCRTRKGAVRTISVYKPYDGGIYTAEWAKDRLPKDLKITKSKYGFSETLYADEVYDALTSMFNSKVIDLIVISWTGKQLVQEVGGKWAAEFMTMAQPGYNGTPSGASKITNYKTDSKTKDLVGYLESKLTSQIVDQYGYDLDKVKGYYFGSNSDLAKLIASNADFKKFINNNKEKLRAGYTATSERDALSFAFTKGNGQDLYYTFHNVNVVKSWVDDKGKLHVIIADTYDFNKSATDILNKCGAAAMEDGKLVPYYTLVEVIV